MTAPDLIDLDDYERRKLAILTFEKVNALFMSFMFVATMALCAVILVQVACDLYVIATQRPDDAGRILRADLSLVRDLPVVLLVLFLGLYFSRASSQSRPRAIRWIRIAVFPLVPAFAYLVYAIPPLQELFVFIWRVYTAHWATMVEVVVIAVFASLSQLDYLRGNRAMRRMTDRDRIFLREDPEKRLLRGRVVRTALGIPRIVDLMPRRRMIASAGFVLANFFFALSIGWIVVYVGFFSYRWYMVLEHHDGLLSSPYIQETAVSHLVYSLSASFLAYAVAPIVGGYVLAFTQRHVRWSIGRLLEADERPPILFLRAFKDDQVQLAGVKLSLLGRTGRWLDGIANLDRLLLEEGTPYGPVVAIGNPRDTFPPYGAARGYFDDKTWQAAVADLARAARNIVVCLDRTDGIWWEVGHIARLGYLPKTLFLVHPKYGAAPENRAFAHEIARELKLDTDINPPTRPGAEPMDGGRAAGLLGFFFDQDGRVQAGCSTTFSRLAFQIQVRWFLRSKLGLATATA